jgi:serine/threonine protein kinase/WD40 repeat protein
LALGPGARLGVYEIVSVLGAGGMGEVYRARDTKLGREVAIKVILDVFAADPDRIARFEREAKVLASLNHPHIAALYGMEESSGQHFLVMELVEGQTLAERLLGGPMSVEETLPIALQIADALEGAHEKGIVHRDLKPANVKVTPDDRVKVLDFGLAKAIENEKAAGSVANSPTLSMMASQAGVILGTAAYMSPEQAKGLPADHRSDVFSFGAVLFEMLTGRQPFQGDTAPEVLASVLVREPDISRLPSDLNPRVTELVRRCLEKQPKRRWQAVGDVRAELEAIAAAPRTSAVAAAPVLPPRSFWRRAMPAVIAAAVVGSLAAAAAWTLKPSTPPAVARFSIRLPADQRFTVIGRRSVAISPDGLLVAYVADRRIYLRPIRDMQGSPLPGAESAEGVSSPVFSPDSRSLAFFSIGDSTLKRVPVSGGAPVTLCFAINPYGVTWSPDGILFGQGTGDLRTVMRVPASGGTAQVLITLQPNELPDGPRMLPGGDSVLFTLATTSRATVERWDKAQVVVQSVKSGARKLLVNGGSDARYLPTGHIAYAIGGSIYAVAFDLRTLTVTGEPFPILEGVRRALAGVTGMADFSVSDTGTLAYVPGPAMTGGGVAFTRVDWQGVGTPLKLSPGPYASPRAAPDGTRVAMESTDGRETFIGVYELAGTTALRRVTFGGNSQFPVWSPDGKRVAFQSGRDGDLAVFSQAADGTGAPERLTKPGAGESHVPHSWQGDVLLFDVVKGNDVRLWQLSLKDKTLAPYGDVRSSSETGAVFRPDGRWVAYSATEAGGVTSIYVQPFPATGAKHVLVRSQRASPHHPIWSPDGSALAYVPGPGMFERVSVSTQPTFGFGNPESVPRSFQGGPPGTRRMYDMMPDGRILGAVTPGQMGGENTMAEILVVLNWFEELKARLPR